MSTMRFTIMNATTNTIVDPMITGLSWAMMAK